jgi:hypothetical protein
MDNSDKLHFTSLNEGSRTQTFEDQKLCTNDWTTQRRAARQITKRDQEKGNALLSRRSIDTAHRWQAPEILNACEKAHESYHRGRSVRTTYYARF